MLFTKATILGYPPSWAAGRRAAVVAPRTWKNKSLECSHLFEAEKLVICRGLDFHFHDCLF